MKAIITTIALCLASAIAGAALLAVVWMERRVSANEDAPGMTEAELEKAGIRQLWAGTAAWSVGHGTHIGTFHVVERSREVAEKNIRELVKRQHPNAEVLSVRVDPVDFVFVKEAYRSRIPGI